MDKSLLMAAFGNVIEARAEVVKTEEPRDYPGFAFTGRYKGAKPIYRVLLTEETVEPEPESEPEEKVNFFELFGEDELLVGGTCPKCRGTGRYVFSDGRSGPCFACHDPMTGKGTGKGYISAKDMAYNNLHIRKGTLYRVKSC